MWYMPFIVTLPPVRQAMRNYLSTDGFYRMVWRASALLTYLNTKCSRKSTTNRRLLPSTGEPKKRGVFKVGSNAGSLRNNSGDEFPNVA